MNRLDVDGLAAMTLVAIVFFVARRVPAYVTLCIGILAGFVYLTEGAPWPNVDDWAAWITAVASCAFGLLIVRVMLERSVSLRLLADITNGRVTIAEDIRERLNDIVVFRLGRQTDGKYSLTSFGRLCSLAIGLLYFLFDTI